jgi:uncharacterized protein (DUF2126 family)
MSTSNNIYDSKSGLIKNSQGKWRTREDQKNFNLNLHWRTARSAPPLSWSENLTRVLPAAALC